MNKYKLFNFRIIFFALIVFAFVLHCLYISSLYYFQNNDDAYISFRYGKNLLNGLGLVYNPGEYVEGYTNFLWTIFMSPFTKISSIDISVFGILFGIFFSILSIFVINQIIKNFSFSFLNSTLIITITIFFYSIDNSIVFWSVAGMEFPMFTFFLLLAFRFYLEINKSHTKVYYLTLFLILLTLTRPEGIIIFTVTVIHMFIFRNHIDNFKVKFQKLIIGYILLISVYYIFKLIYYGQLLPNTFYAKGISDISINFISGYKYIKWSISERIYLLIFIFFIYYKNFINDFRYSFIFILILIYTSYLIFIGGDWMMANRFFSPLIPFLYILSSIGIMNFFKYINNKIPNIRTVNTTIKFVVIIIIAIFLNPISESKLAPVYSTRNWEKQCVEFGKWLKVNASPDSKIAIGAAGKIPYYSELYSIDIWGLNDKYIAGLPNIREQTGHRKFDFNYVLSRNPDYIIVTGFDEYIPASYEKFDPEDVRFISIEKSYRRKN